MAEDIELKETPEEALLSWAWAIIANSSGGNWEKESEDWQRAARNWADEYHKHLYSKGRLDI